MKPVRKPVAKRFSEIFSLPRVAYERYDIELKKDNMQLEFYISTSKHVLFRSERYVYRKSSFLYISVSGGIIRRLSLLYSLECCFPLVSNHFFVIYRKIVNQVSFTSAISKFHFPITSFLSLHFMPYPLDLKRDLWCSVPQLNHLPSYGVIPLMNLLLFL